MKNSFLVFLLFGLSASFAQEAKKRQVSPAQIDAVFSKWNTTDKAGIAVGILSEGQIIYTKGYGLANLEHRIPIGVDTKFYIGDLAKEFTVYAILLLEEQGEISLKDDIRSHMPQLDQLPNAVSIEQLIHHTSGLNNDEVARVLAGWRPEDPITKDQVYKMIQNQAEFLPESGSKQVITDTGFMILEDLVAQISGLSFPDFVTQNIFEPLGMTSSLFDTNGAVIQNKAQGYFLQNGVFVSSNMTQAHTSVSDVYSTVGDMCLWAKELGNPQVGTERMVKKFDGLSVVDGSGVKEENQALYLGGHRYWNFRGAKKLFHVEVAGGYACKLIRYPSYDLAVVVLGNDGAYNGSQATGASALYLEDFLDTFSSEETKIVSKTLTSSQLKKFEGDYWDIGSHATRKIHLLNDTLRYHRWPGNESALVPLSNNTFKMITWGDVEVHFDLTAGQKTMNVVVGESTSQLLSFDKNASWTKEIKSFAGSYYSAAFDTHYQLELKENKLTLTHPRLDPIELAPRLTDSFTSNQRHFTSLAFSRDANGDIQGFELATRGVENVWFQKESSARKYSVKAQ